MSNTMRDVITAAVKEAGYDDENLVNDVHSAVATHLRKQLHLVAQEHAAGRRVVFNPDKEDV